MPTVVKVSLTTGLASR